MQLVKTMIDRMESSWQNSSYEFKCHTSEICFLISFAV